MLKNLKTGAVCAAALIFTGLLVKEWIAVKAADSTEAKTGQPPRPKAKSVLLKDGAITTFTDLFDTRPKYPLYQFFYRIYQPGYVSDPMIQKLDLDDPRVLEDFRRYPTHFLDKLEETQIDINTVQVRPDPANIRVLSLQDGNPATSWTLHLLTGEDTAQQLEDGIHLRRRGFPEKIVGSPVAKDDSSVHSESSTILWRPNGRGGWKIDPNGSGRVNSVSISTIYETRRIRSSEVGQGSTETVPRYQLDCAALRQFARPLQPGESTREITLKVDVPVSPNWKPSDGRRTPCVIDLQREPLDSLHPKPVYELPQRSSSAPQPVTQKPAQPGAEVITVDARRMWTPTQIVIDRGQIIRLRATGTVTGTTSHRDAAFRWVGPTGWGIEPKFVSGRYNLLLGHGSSFMCLTAKINKDGAPFNASSASFTASDTGVLYFGVNDAVANNDPELYFRDNAGSFKVTVTVEQQAKE